jgi:hypothetical protein
MRNTRKGEKAITPWRDLQRTRGVGWVERSGTHQPPANNTDRKPALGTVTAEYRFAEYEYEYKVKDQNKVKGILTTKDAEYTKRE